MAVIDEKCPTRWAWFGLLVTMVLGCTTLPPKAEETRALKPVEKTNAKASAKAKTEAKARQPVALRAEPRPDAPCKLVRQETERAVLERLTCMSSAHALTSDGSTVAGQFGRRLSALLWRDGRLIEMDNGALRAIDDDGETAVGLLKSTQSRGSQPGVWLNRGRGRALEGLTGQGRAITPDGRYAAGFAWGYNGRTIAALRWDLLEGGRVELGTIATGPHGDNVQATAISDDGQVVVGTARARKGQVAFYWRDGAMGALPPLGYGQSATAAACNADCSVIGGLSTGPSGANEAVRWIGGDPALLFPMPAGAKSSNLQALDASGDVAGGEVFFPSGGPLGIEVRGYRWSARDGMAFVDDIAKGRGLELGDFRFWNVAALSADGNVLAGRGATLGSIEWTAYRLVLR